MKYLFSEIFFSAKYLQMFTTYLLYNGETERLNLEFENFNSEYFKLRRKFNKMMNKPEGTEGTDSGVTIVKYNQDNICQTLKMWRE